MDEQARLYEEMVALRQRLEESIEATHLFRLALAENMTRTEQRITALEKAKEYHAHILYEPNGDELVPLCTTIPIILRRLNTLSSLGKWAGGILAALLAAWIAWGAGEVWQLWVKHKTPTSTSQPGLTPPPPGRAGQ